MVKLLEKYLTWFIMSPAPRHSEICIISLIRILCQNWEPHCRNLHSTFYSFINPILSWVILLNFHFNCCQRLAFEKVFLWNTLVRGLWQSLLWGEGLGWWLWNAKLQVCLGALKLWVRGVLQPWGEGNRLVSWREGGLLRVESSSEPRGRVTGLWGQDLQNCLNHQCMSSVALVPPVIYLNIPIIWKINVSFQKKHFGFGFGCYARTLHMSAGAVYVMWWSRRNWEIRC